jgi:hypothetical protein
MNRRSFLPTVSRIVTGLREAASLPLLLPAFVSMHLASRSFQRAAL